jgi:hypothetical protein
MRRLPVGCLSQTIIGLWTTSKVSEIAQNTYKHMYACRRVLIIMTFTYLHIITCAICTYTLILNICMLIFCYLCIPRFLHYIFMYASYSLGRDVLSSHKMHLPPPSKKKSWPDLGHSKSLTSHKKSYVSLYILRAVHHIPTYRIK